MPLTNAQLQARARAKAKARLERYRSALEQIAARADKLRTGTDDWFELAEFYHVAHTALRDQ